MTGYAAWLDAALTATDTAAPAVLVTVAETKGSAPRETGAKMLVLTDRIVGSVGGGQLELLAIDAARRLMMETEARPALTRHSLGPDLGQCCGGAVRLLLEPLTEADRGWLEAWRRHAADQTPMRLATGADGNKAWSSGSAGDEAARVEEAGAAWRVMEAVRQSARPLWLYGAGHVGRAVATVLSELDFDLTWLDSRPDWFPRVVPAGVRPVVAPGLADTVESAPRNCLFLVMTHSHQLDLDICDRVLRRGDCAFLGLIGSATKKARFLGALRAHGPAALERLVCPIGLAGVPGKQPMAIAVSVAAQLLVLPQMVERAVSGRDTTDLRGAG